MSQAVKKRKATNSKKRNAIILVMLFALVGVAMLVSTKAAAPPATPMASSFGAANLYLTPATGSYDISTNFTVGVFVNGGSELINAVGPQLTYDATKLEFVSVDTNGGAFPDCFDNAGGNGKVTLNCGKRGNPLSGSQKIGNITFKAKVGSGSTQVQFASGSVVYKGDAENIWDGNTNGGSYGLTTPSAPGGGTPSDPTPPGTPGSPPKDPVDDTQAPPGSSVGNNSPTSPSNGSAVRAKPIANGSPDDKLEEVISTPQNGPAGVVGIIITDKTGKVVPGAKVTLGDTTLVTDANGLVSFTGLAAGKYKVVAKTKNGEVKASINVASIDGTVNAQSFKLIIKTRSMIPYYTVGGVTSVILLVVMVIIVIKRIGEQRFYHRSHSSEAGSPVTNGSKPVGASVPASAPTTIAPVVIAPGTSVSSPSAPSVTPQVVNPTPTTPAPTPAPSATIEPTNSSNPPEPSA